MEEKIDDTAASSFQKRSERSSASSIEENVAEAPEEIVSSGGTEYSRVLQRRTDLGLESGAVHNALPVLCAEKASAGESERRDEAPVLFDAVPSEARTGATWLLETSD